MRVVTEERGAVSLLVVGLLIPLIGAGALAVDISSLYQERRELQNGADAAVLAVAKDCVTYGACDSSLTVDSTAGTYANQNASDGRSDVIEICGSGPGLSECDETPSVPVSSTFAKVTADTFQVGGDNPQQINFVLAPVLELLGSGDDFKGGVVKASAVAAWGYQSPSRGTTLPITFSLCEYNEFVTSAKPLQAAPPFAGDPANIAIHSNLTSGECPAGPSGFDEPGGFGWLDTDSNCQVTLEVGDMAMNRTGNSPGCVNLTKLQDKTIFIPVFDETNRKNGSNLEYHIYGFAAFHLTGYRYPSENYSHPDYSGPDCPGSGKSGFCLSGYFRGFSTSAGSGSDGPPMGVTLIKLVG